MKFTEVIITGTKCKVEQIIDIFPFSLLYSLSFASQQLFFHSNMCLLFIIIT